MTQMSRGPVVTVKPQPNIYTLLLIVAIVMLGIGLGVVMHNLMANYGLEFGQLFDPGSVIENARK